MPTRPGLPPRRRREKTLMQEAKAKDDEHAKLKPGYDVDKITIGNLEQEVQAKTNEKASLRKTDEHQAQSIVEIVNKNPKAQEHVRSMQVIAVSFDDVPFGLLLPWPRASTWCSRQPQRPARPHHPPTCTPVIRRTSDREDRQLCF
jgi:hypothetical protein